MRNMLIRGLLSAALSVGLVSASIAAGHDDFVTTQYSGAGGSLIKVWGGRGGGSCEELRLACMYKERLGEVGQGNCRRYREQCSDYSPPNRCDRLRWKCMHKEEIGGVGMGYCREYRESCR